MSYIYPAPYKTGAGRGNPKLIKATPDAASVFFCVRYTRHSMAWCVLFNVGNYSVITHNGTHRAALIMVALTGQSQGWPVPFIAGISTPVNVTAPIERGNSGGDSLNQIKEAANMATTPTPSQPKIVLLPYVSAVDPSGSAFAQAMHYAEQLLLSRVKEALDEAGVAWFDPRTKEHSKPAATDNVEGSDNA
ncbi:ash family protein [Salmonella enterica]|nr:ash family protein [Salmonella enterica]